MASLKDLIVGNSPVKPYSELTELDLLKRQQVITDESAIEQLFRHKRILITGAGGSIGSEVSRQVAEYAPSFLGMLDRDESALHAVQLSMRNKTLSHADSLILADIRDPKRLTEIFQQVKPELLIHAAALKHVNFLQHAPEEAFKTNVLGTLNVLEAAKQVGVEVFINISTDKAADPSSALGFSKLIAERLTAAVNQGRFVSVRFGNVLGSRGSVLPTFQAQIASGGPVTVTHPEVTRYFMSIPEAVHLVLEAATIGQAGETLIWDMGSPVKIDEIARLLIAHSGKPIEIVYTGLRPGEKLHETLISDAEVGYRPSPWLITHVNTLPLDSKTVLAWTDTSVEGLARLARI
jgi:FlaA1/EpsC-like NDP-sugar epimerase